MAIKKSQIEKWIVAQKKHRLSDTHVQMARELGLNPDKLGKIDNHRQESWKAPLPEFIEEIFYKRFKKERPDVVKSLKQILKDEELKAKMKKKATRIIIFPSSNVQRFTIVKQIFIITFFSWLYNFYILKKYQRYSRE